MSARMGTRAHRGRTGYVVAAIVSLAAACGDDAVTILTSTGAAVKVPPGTAIVEASVRTAGPRIPDRVTLDVRPAGVTVNLTYEAKRSSFTGLVTIAAGPQTLTVTSYRGRERVGTSINVGTIVLVQGTAATLDALVLDTSAGWPFPGSSSPVVTALALSPTTLLVDGTLYVSAQSEAPTAAKLSYAWTSSCAGRFSPATARTATWTPSAPGKCTITVTAASVLGSGRRSGVVSVSAPPGRADIVGTFVPFPAIQEITLTTGGGSCDLLRSAANASCRVPITPGSSVVVTSSHDTLAGSSLDWSDDCGGTFVARDLAQFPATATYEWTAPSDASPRVCMLTPTLTLDGMADTFPVAVLVADPPVQ